MKTEKPSIPDAVKKILETPQGARLRRDYAGYTLAELARADPALAHIIGKELDDKEQA